MHLIFIFPAWILIMTSRTILEITLWPLFALLETMVTRLKFANKKRSMEDVEYMDKKDEQSTRAHLLEVCLESSFQVIVKDTLCKNVSVFHYNFFSATSANLYHDTMFSSCSQVHFI